MGIARIGMAAAALGAMAAAAGAAHAADLAVRVKNETNGDVITRLHAQGNAWTSWSEVLPQDAVKHYTFRNGASVFYIEVRYDDGREWRHVCTKSINADRGFQVTMRGPVPHMACDVGSLDGATTAQATAPRRRVAAAPASAPAPAPAPAARQHRTATRAPITQTAGTQAAPATSPRAQRTKARRIVHHVRTTTTAPAARRDATPAPSPIPTEPDRRGSYSREAACLDAGEVWDAPRTWCHVGHTMYEHR